MILRFLCSMRPRWKMMCVFKNKAQRDLRASSLLPSLTSYPLRSIFSSSPPHRIKEHQSGLSLKQQRLLLFSLYQHAGRDAKMYVKHRVLTWLVLLSTCMPLPPMFDWNFQCSFAKPSLCHSDVFLSLFLSLLNQFRWMLLCRGWLTKQSQKQVGVAS